MEKIRLLKANEIDVRVQSISKGDKGAVLLLYKDARCDMRILDETFGPNRWQRKHEVINDNLFCSVGVLFDGNWVWKQDVGVESYTEKEKGQASDSFKRACFNWGIGRELYTSPFIYVNNTGDMKDGKFYTKFKVESIEYDDNRNISLLTIVDDKGNVRYSYPKQIAPRANTQATKPLSEAQVKRLYAIAKSAGIDAATVKEHIMKRFKKEVENLTKVEYDTAVAGYENFKKGHP